MPLKQTNRYCIKQTCTKQEEQNEAVENLKQYSYFPVACILDNKISTEIMCAFIFIFKNKCVNVQQTKHNLSKHF